MSRAAGAQAPVRLHRRAAEAGLVDVARLEEDLRRAVAGEVRFDAGSRALYATDASNYRQVPTGVVVPRDAGDIASVVAVAARHRAPLLARGGGTSLAGQSCNAALVIDCSKYLRRIIGIEPGARLARVEPGVVLDDLRQAASRHGLTFGPDPSTHQYCTLGGMIGNNSCGVHSVMSARLGPGPTTADNVEALEVITAGGMRLRAESMHPSTFDRIVAEGGPRATLFRELKAFQERHAEVLRHEFPDIPRRVSGYNLPALLPEHGFHVGRALVGSESTLALVLEAEVRLIPALPHRVMVVLGFEDVFTAADHVPEVLAFDPVGLEGFDQGLADDLRDAGLQRGHLHLLPEGGGWLLVEFGADTPEDARTQAEAFVAGARAFRQTPSVRVYESVEDQAHLWEIRESGLAATARTAHDEPTWPGWEDSAVPPERFGAYLRDIDALFRRFDYRADLYGHFGQGCLHCRIDFDLRSESGIATFRRFLEEAADLVHRHGGALSGEHGDGQARGELLDRMYSPAVMRAFREFKAIWDPEGRMNPGKVIDARPIDANLRLGTDYDPRDPEPWFALREDDGRLSRAAMRCVGVGKCRKTDAGTMCPSYMVTHEEMHSTRGRAHLLFEMLRSDPAVLDPASKHVHEALDLCLACKACKAECPVGVDMATYKAEFLAHYYEHHRRPLAAYAFGFVPYWARLGALAPHLANLAARLPGVRHAAKRLVGMAPERRIPQLAGQTFRQWFRSRPGRPAGTKPRVMLWPDTFSDHFHPQTLRAAHDVLEGAGFAVEIPPAPVCCGRPLYDFGLLSRARAELDTAMTTLGGALTSGLPIVGLEPSCVSVFRDELRNLFPDDVRARRLGGQILTFAEFLERHADTLPPLRLDRAAVVHRHCHHQAIMGFEADRAVLDRTGLRYEVLDSGCCGMAGAFGFERDHYDVSMAVGERVLLPVVRTARPDTLVVADGFSCREQIAQATDRRALHLAEVVHMAMFRGPDGPPGDRPEREYAPGEDGAPWRAMVAAAAIGAAGVLALGLATHYRGEPAGD